MVNIPTNIQNSWELVPNVVFPHLYSKISDLASRLTTDPDVYLQRLPYNSTIRSYGGPLKMAEMLLRWVDPQIKTLEGKLLRTETYVKSLNWEL